ncbi:MAG: TadE family protein [Phycisphaerae bacterium]
MKRRKFPVVRGREGYRARAAAIVEFAVVLPLLLTILFGVIEYGWVFMVRQTLQNAAREGCRQAILQTSVPPYTNVTDRINEVLAPTGLTPAEVTVTMTHATPGDPVETVVISVPRTEVSLVGGFFGISGGTLTASTSMRKEGIGGG